MAKKKQPLTQQMLKARLTYCPQSGLFTWLTSKGGVKPGSIAGCIDSDGYITIGLNGSNWLAHRLAVLYMLGELPEQVDHSDRNRLNNAWSNLIPGTSTTNHRNYPLQSNNTSGKPGVSYYRGKWHASIKVNTLNIYIGGSVSKEDAIALREQAEKEFNFHPNHGK